MKPIIYFDMDGVLADFEKWAASITPEWKWQIEQPAWGIFGSRYPHMFSLLPVMSGSHEMFNVACELTGDKNQVQILTALPSRAFSLMPNAARDKIQWARLHISPDVRVHFGPYAQDKQYHAQHPHDILIDDMERNIEQWIAAGGIGILHKDPEDTIKQLRIAYEAIK